MSWEITQQQIIKQLYVFSVMEDFPGVLCKAVTVKQKGFGVLFGNASINIDNIAWLILARFHSISKLVGPIQKVGVFH